MKAWQVIAAGAVFVSAVAIGYVAPALPALIKGEPGRSGPPEARVPPEAAKPTLPTPEAAPRPADPAPPLAKPATPTPPAARPAQPPFAAPPAPANPLPAPPSQSPAYPPFGQRPPSTEPALPPYGMTPPGSGPGWPSLPPGFAPPGPFPAPLPPMLMLPPGGGYGGPSLPRPALPFTPPGGGAAPPPPGAKPSPVPDLSPRPPSAPFAPHGSPPGAASSVVRGDIAYGLDAMHRLDLYLPPGGGPAPMLLFVHGGGWSIGDKAEMRWLGEKLAQQGVVVAAPNYRLSPSVQHPEHARDVARAIAWLYRHGAEYGGDPERLYVGGHSAGAHLAALVALDDGYLAAEGLSPAVVRGVAGVAGAAYDLDARYVSTPIVQLLAAAFGKDPARWAEAAPIRYVRKEAPPFLLIHGLADTQAPAAAAQALASALQRDGVAVKLELLPGHEHGSALLASLPSLRAFVQ